MLKSILVTLTLLQTGSDTNVGVLIVMALLPLPYVDCTFFHCFKCGFYMCCFQSVITKESLLSVTPTVKNKGSDDNEG